MLMKGFDGQSTIVLEGGRVEGGERGGCACASRAVEAQGMHARLAAAAHEVVLERQRAFVGVDERAHGIVRHGQYGGGDAERLRDGCREIGELAAGGQQPGTAHVDGEVAVAEAEPGVAAELAQRIHEAPGLVAAAPAEDRVLQIGKRVGHGVDVGRDREPQVLEVIGGVDDRGDAGGARGERQAVDHA